MSEPLEAQVIDERHLKLKKPIKIPPGSTIMVTIVPPGTVSDEHEWYHLSLEGLIEAYGEDEPDYPLNLIKVPNPDYEP